MDQALCRDHLAELLGEEIVLLTELQQLLEEEHDLIGAGEPEALLRTTAARQERLGALARIEEQRRSLCSLHGEAPDRAGLDRLRQWCDPNGVLEKQLAECLGRALRCRDLNDRNGPKARGQVPGSPAATRQSVRSDPGRDRGPHGSAAAPRPLLRRRRASRASGQTCRVAGPIPETSGEHPLAPRCECSARQPLPTPRHRRRPERPARAPDRATK